MVKVQRLVVSGSRACLEEPRAYRNEGSALGVWCNRRVFRV